VERPGLEILIRNEPRSFGFEPVSPAALSQWGDMLFNRKDMDGGNGRYQEAVKANPSLAWLYNNWGVSLENHGYFAEAIEKYSRSLSLNPGDPQVRYNYAIMLPHLKIFLISKAHSSNYRF
jgi:tetratricopeptide (TPR) repeat protein